MTAGLDLRHDLGWFDQLLGEVRASGRGRLVFVGGNRQVFLRQCVQRAEDLDGVLVGASLSFRPSRGRADTGAEVGADFVNLGATAAGLAIPWLQVAGPAASLFVRAFKARSDDTYFADDLLQLVHKVMSAAGPDRTVVCGL